MSQPRLRPSVAPAGRHDDAAALDEQQGGLLAGSGALLQRLGHAPGRAVDHRAARFARLAAAQLALARRGHDPGLDAELAQAEALVGLELDHGSRQQREPLAARVLEQVARELGGQRAPRSRQSAPGRAGRGTRGTRWARRSATPTSIGAPPSPARACARSRPAGLRIERPWLKVPSTSPAILLSRLLRTLMAWLLPARTEA